MSDFKVYDFEDDDPQRDDNPQRGHKRQFVLFRDLEPSSRKEWLASDFLGAGEASAFYGMPGCGKSVLAEDMGLHVAAGWAWHGRKAKQGAVVYVALERRRLVERRAIAFRKKHSVTDLPFAIVGGVHDFRDPRTAAWLADVVADVEKATGQPVVLIIIDTLSRALCGGDENSPKDMGAIVHATGSLQDSTGAHVTWVHHMPMDSGERMRGHGALLGALDTTVHVSKTGTVRTASVVKASDSEEARALPSRCRASSSGTTAGPRPLRPWSCLPKRHSRPLPNRASREISRPCSRCCMTPAQPGSR